MSHSLNRQLKAHHATDVSPPKTAGIHNHLAMDRAPVCGHIPCTVGTLGHTLDHCVFKDLRAALAGGLGVGLNHRGWVDPAVQRIEHCPDIVTRVDERMHTPRLSETDKL